jgi:parallel beta-helix repeat protein
MRSIKGQLTILIILLVVLGSSQSYAGGLNLPAGSNGGKICEITSLVDGNFPGTLRRAMENGYNINDSELPSFCTEKIVFKVAGTITLERPLVLDNSAATGFSLERAPGVTGEIILDASGVGEGGCAIVIDSDQVTIKGIAIRNAPEGGICIKRGSNQNSIENVIISNSKNGVVIDAGSSNNVIQNSQLFDNTGYGVKMADATQNLVSHNALYRNGAGPIDSPATDLQPTIESVAAANGAATSWTIFGTIPGAVGHVEIYRGAPTSGSQGTNYIVDVVDVATNSFQVVVEGRAGEEVFAIGIAADGTTSPASAFATLSVTGGGTGNGPGTGDRRCFTGQEFPVTADFDADGIPDVLEDVNKNCVSDPGETDPENDDSDGDGLKDGIEDRNKNGQKDAEESDPRTQDTDLDDLTDGVEDKNKNGLKDSNESAAYNEDSDDDGITDQLEDKDKDGEFDEGVETKAYDDDTDFDGKKDGEEDINRDGVHDRFRESDPRKSDTDGDFNPDSSDVCPNIPYATCKVPCIPGVEPAPELDDDGDGLPNFIEDRDHSCGNGLAVVGDPDVGETHSYKRDTDQDNRKDGEDQCPNDPNPDCEGVCDPELINEFTDSDLDGLTNDKEDLNGNCFVDSNESDPFNPDSDDDQASDGEDVCPLDRNPLCNTPCRIGSPKPLEQDSDGDGITDDNEDIDLSCGANGNETDFRKQDSDGDGLNDNFDPCPVNEPNTSCTRQCFKGEFIAPGRDSDGDGIEDVLEDLDKDCSFETGETDSYNKDSDADGLPDGVEDFNRNGIFDEGETDPRNPDSDGDGLIDGLEDRNFNGRKDFGECDAKLSDTDADGVLDFNEDINLNGIFDAGETNCDRGDTDQDGLVDGAEDKNANGFVDAGETDARNPDTDGDGANDGQEMQNGTNPIFASENDFNRALGGQGCSLGAANPATWSYFHTLGLALLALASVRIRKKK